MNPSADNVFLAPCDPGNFDRTVRSPVDPGEFGDVPAALDGLDDVRLWGASDGSRNRTYFEKMDAGDLVLFYQDGTYVGTGLIGTTFEDEDGWASTALWEDVSLPFVYTVEEFTEVAVPKAAVNEIFDYGATYTPQGFMRVADSRVANSPAVIKRAVEKYDQRND